LGGIVDVPDPSGLRRREVALSKRMEEVSMAKLDQNLEKELNERFVLFSRRQFWPTFLAVLVGVLAATGTTAWQAAKAEAEARWACA